jgi:hypothetical protein
MKGGKAVFYRYPSYHYDVSVSYEYYEEEKNNGKNISKKKGKYKGQTFHRL